MLPYRLKLGGVLFNGLGVQDLSIVLAHIQVLVVVLREGDLLLVVCQLQVRRIVLLLRRDFLPTL